MMYKMNKIYILAVVIIAFNCCNVKKYSEAVKEDTERIFSSNKAFIHNLSMNGTVKDKFYSKDNYFNKYVLRISIYNLSDHPSINEIQYPPYYSFINDSLIDISVSEYLYNNTNVGSIFAKEINTNIVLINNNKFQLLNIDENKWLP